VFALGAVGGLAGAVFATPLAHRVGTARTVWVSILTEVPFLFATPLAFRGWGVLLVTWLAPLPAPPRWFTTSRRCPTGRR